MKNLKKRSALIMMAVALFVICCPMMAFAAEEEYVPSMYATWMSLLPPVIAIGLALITKEVYSSLFIGIAVGAILYAGGNFEGTLQHLLTDGIIGNLSDSYNVGILVFLVILGSIVCLMNATGGSAAFGRWAQTRIKTRVGAQLCTVALGCLIFVDDYFNCLTVGSVMRPITESHKVSKAKLAYLIDSTAAPVCIIAPVSSWAAAVSGFVEGQDGFQVFLSAIPYNYYALLTIYFMIALTIMRIDYGPMKLHEENAINGDIYTTAERPYAEAEKEMETANPNGKVIDLVFPVVVIIICCIVGITYSGGIFEGTSFIDSFANSDAAVGLSFGSLIALIIIVIYYMIRRVISFRDAMDCIPEGFKAMVPAILILTFAWTLKTMTDSLGAAPYVAGLVAAGAASFINFLPAIVFLVGCFLGFATGTSWGTFGVLIPIVIAAFSDDPQMMTMSISACMAGAVCGDHCSPISDTTIMASAGAQCYHINHVNTQIPYAVTVAATSFVSYIIAGFVRSAFIALPIALVLMTLVLLVIRKKFGVEQKGV